MIRRILKDFFIYVGLPILFLLIVTLVNAPMWIIEITAMVIFVCILFFLLTIAFPLTTKQTKYHGNTTLYQWLDDLSDFDQKLVYSLNKFYVSRSTQENLNNLKNMLKKQSQNDKSTLKMYRAFYNQKLKESGEELYLRTIMISLIPVGILLVKGNEKLFVEQPLQILLPVIFMFLILAFISMRLSVNKKRNGILIEIIDLCIEDIDDEENSIKEKEGNEQERKRRLRILRRNLGV